MRFSPFRLGRAGGPFAGLAARQHGAQQRCGAWGDESVIDRSKRCASLGTVCLSSVSDRRQPGGVQSKLDTRFNSQGNAEQVPRSARILELGRSAALKMLAIPLGIAALFVLQPSRCGTRASAGTYSAFPHKNDVLAAPCCTGDTHALLR